MLSMYVFLLRHKFSLYIRSIAKLVPSKQMAPASALLMHPFLLYMLLVLSSTAHGGEAETFIVVTRKQLNPRATCSEFKGSNHTILSLAHRHGPCSPLESKKPLSLEQILAKDHLRVDYLQKSSSTNDLLDSKASIPANYESGAYAITVKFGTPAQQQSVAMDTGSDLTWIQCKPCSVCYSQHDPIFDPSQSSTYAAIPCGSQDCDLLKHSCSSSSSCEYSIEYGDDSTTLGTYSYETLTLSPGNAIERFLFGCGVDNEGLFNDVDGLVGLGRRQTSLVSQTSRIYGGIFSYCLPTPRSTGFLKLGGPVASNAQYTTMLTSSSRPSFYFLDLTGILVGGKDLGISPSVFASGGTLLDSGTTITRLPREAYTALRDAFRSHMTDYPAAAPPTSLFDTCYDFSGYRTVTIPRVALQFGGGVTVDLDFNGILFSGCLAFASVKGEGFGIIGNRQQLTFEVVYDVGNEKIGFVPSACT